MKFLLGESMRCDLEILLESRMLIQATSGGGKSRTLRRILEQTHGRVQQIIIDPEGELVSLREKFDYVLAAAHGGETPADPRSAPLLAERLLQLGVSAICDLSDLKRDPQVDFVKRLCVALIEAPKALRHPLILAMDEIQIFAPEGLGCDSTLAVIDVATRGRKRGLCLIAATQRISLFNKNAAAPLRNKLIGMTALDTDLKRAGAELGFDKDTTLSLRGLESMHFWAFGPALVKAPTLVEVGPHVTSHPRPGAKLKLKTPPPTAKIKALLPKLADLPAEAEEERRTLVSMQQENADLRRQKAALERAAPARVETKVETRVQRVEVPMLKGKEIGALTRITERLEKTFPQLRDVNDGLRAIVSGIREIVASAERIQRAPPTGVFTKVESTPGSDRPILKPSVSLVHLVRGAEIQGKPNGGALPKGEKAILIAVAQNDPGGAARDQITVLTGYKRTSRDTYLQRLVNRGYVYQRGGHIYISNEGQIAINAMGFEPLPTGDALLSYWRARLPSGERKVLDAVVASYPVEVARAMIYEHSGYKRSSCDTYLQRLALRRLVKYTGGGMMASELLFD